MHFIRVTYRHGQGLRQVPEPAVQQALKHVFGVDVTGDADTERAWGNRSLKEKTAAFCCAWMWLIAQDEAEMHERAAPWAAILYNAIGPEDFYRIAENFQLSSHQVAQMVTTDPPEAISQAIKKHRAANHY
jgi:hypothetical protein